MSGTSGAWRYAPCCRICRWTYPSPARAAQGGPVKAEPGCVACLELHKRVDLGPTCRTPRPLSLNGRSTASLPGGLACAFALPCSAPAQLRIEPRLQPATADCLTTPPRRSAESARNSQSIPYLGVAIWCMPSVHTWSPTLHDHRCSLDPVHLHLATCMTEGSACSQAST